MFSSEKNAFIRALAATAARIPRTPVYQDQPIELNRRGMDEAALLGLLSGRTRGFGASVLRGGLQLASGVYGLAIRARNLAYNRHWFRVHRTDVPVISVGNITTGGTGKTPVTAWITNWLVEQGQYPVLISRGYHSLPQHDASSSTPSANDEKLLLDQLCPGVPHLQHPDRVRSATRAISQYACSVMLLDDGFQHRRLHRDLDIVLIDAVNPWGYDHLLPRGLLREPLSGLQRADLIMLTRVDQCPSEQYQTILQRLLGIRGIQDHVEVKFTPQLLTAIDGSTAAPDAVRGQRILAFCGIGNPEGFRQTIASLAVECAAWVPFPDHHHYDQIDLSRIAESARNSSAAFVLTTQKDLVKIASSAWRGPPLYAVEIGVEFVRGRELLESALQRVLTDR